MNSRTRTRCSSSAVPPPRLAAQHPDDAIAGGARETLRSTRSSRAASPAGSGVADGPLAAVDGTSRSDQRRRDHPCPARRCAPPTDGESATPPSTRRRRSSGGWRCSREEYGATSYDGAGGAVVGDRALRPTTTTRSGTAGSWSSATATAGVRPVHQAGRRAGPTSSPTPSPSSPPAWSTRASPGRSTSRSPTCSRPASSSGCSGQTADRGRDWLIGGACSCRRSAGGRCAR